MPAAEGFAEELMKRDRRSSPVRGVVLISFILFLLLLAAYYLLAVYYRSGFSLNTWINGVYCTGKTVEEVNRELIGKTEPPTVVISTDSGWDAAYDNVIDLGGLGYQCDYLAALNDYMEKQNPFLWVDNITFHREHRIEPEISYDEAALREAFEQTCVQNYSQMRSGEYTLDISEKSGWGRYDGLTHVIDTDRAFELVKDAIARGQYEINIDGLDCFYDIPFTKQQEETRRMWEKLQAFLDCDLSYDMGDAAESPNVVQLSYFIQHSYRDDLKMEYPVLDEAGQFVLNEEEIRTYVAGLAKKYDTYGKEREFQSTRGDLIKVPAKGTYGTTLDQDAEVAYLMENLLSEELHDGRISSRIPVYERQGFVRGTDDIGGTYIEIDMTQQHLYYYVDHELKFDTDVVTGNTGRRMGTPEGVNYVYSKQKNRTLRGPGYATPVKYWMPVKGNVGIHDAGWRSEFGGEIYKKSGSHGCINVPKDVMGELYDMVEIGTPVVMFY